MGLLRILPPQAFRPTTPAAIGLSNVDSMGDSACWLAQTCNNCGRVLHDTRQRVVTCPHCGGPTTERDPSQEPAVVRANDPREPTFGQFLDPD